MFGCVCLLWLKPRGRLAVVEIVVDNDFHKKQKLLNGDEGKNDASARSYLTIMSQFCHIPRKTAQHTTNTPVQFFQFFFVMSAHHA
jgi:hypothetical protein